MRFTSIEVNGTAVKIEDVKFSDLVTFFKSHVFNKFMDSGRRGLESAAVDTLDNFIVYAQAKNRLARRVELTDAEYRECLSCMTEGLMNAFITGGTGNLIPAFYMGYELMFNKLTQHLVKSPGR